MTGYWLQDSVLVSKHITNIDKIIMGIRIINNEVLPSGRLIDVCWTRVISESRVTKRRQDKQE